MDPGEAHARKLEHAKWRVGHIRTLLKQHRAMQLGTEEWRKKEKVYLTRLEAAIQLLNDLEDPRGGAA